MAEETQRTSRLSAAGRLRCSEAGRANLPALLQGRKNRPNAKQVAVEFEAGLMAELGGEPTMSQRALIVSATASFVALFIISQRLRTAHRHSVVAGLIEAVTPLSGTLNRSLRTLGISASAVGDEADLASLAPDERRKRAQQYVKQALAAEQGDQQ